MGKRCVSSVNGNLASAVLCPGNLFVSGNKRMKESDINDFHVPCHAHFRGVEATA